jgi:archaellum component FlaG (FlaF/FlaG flagellin family)
MTRHTVPGTIEPDGTMLFWIDCPAEANRIEIAGVTWDIPAGATGARITVNVTDSGDARIGVRPVYDFTEDD